MQKAEITETKDLNYKAGYIECACGWRKELGDGFNGYHIANCPNCTAALTTRNQRKVIFGENKRLTAEIGENWYFVLSNGIHVRYQKVVHARHTGLTERQADKL